MECYFLDVNTVILMTIPVTVASVERYFSKSMQFTTYLRKSMSQERLRDRVILTIENEKAHSLELGKIISDFANNKARKIHI